MDNYIILTNNKLYLFIFFLFLSFGVKAQNEKKLINMADGMYMSGDKIEAIDVYKKALKKNANNAYINFMIGKCYIESIHKAKSLPYFLSALSRDSSIESSLFYLVGFAYHLNYKFDSAVYFYNKYKSKIQLNPSMAYVATENKKIERRIYECKNACEFIKNPVKVKIENIGSVINTKYADYAPVVSSDQTMLYFTSKRIGSTGGRKDIDNECFEDIYVSYWKDGAWTNPVNLGEHINTDLHEASIGLSPDGNELFIYKDDDKNTGDIFYCKKSTSGEWSKPQLLEGINTRYIENSVSISIDGKTLFFSSDKPGGYGGMDIYMSKLNQNGTLWEKPVNLGPEINTEYDDEGPFISIDGKYLYFCSRGHNGMGGMDLYKSEFIEDKWRKPENLKYPVNSVDDDLYFVTSGDGLSGYYASVKEDVIGDLDIYKISFEPEKKVDVSASSEIETKKVKLTIWVRDIESKLTLNSIIEVRDASDNNLIFSGKSDRGFFQIEIEENNLKDFKIYVRSEGYIFKTEILNNIYNQTEYTKTVELMKIKVGTSIVLRNIYFDFDKASLKKESDSELEKLALFLNENKQVYIEIGGHTDFKGTDKYNIILSQRRAEKVVEWLVRNGIDRYRLKAKGYGENNPLASNDDEEEGCELNRRTEFTILKSNNGVVVR